MLKWKEERESSKEKEKWVMERKSRWSLISPPSTSISQPRVHKDNLVLMSLQHANQNKKEKKKINLNIIRPV